MYHCGTPTTRLVLKYVNESGCEENTTTKEEEKMEKYQERCCKLRVQNPGWYLGVILLVAECLGNIGKLEMMIKKLIQGMKTSWLAAEM